MQKLVLFILCFCALNSQAQVFFEDFEGEADGATTGTASGVAWTATCPHCGPSGDMNEVNTVSGNNWLQNTDSNGPAYWETDPIDISSCASGVTISIDIAEVGTMEAVSCGGACNAGDGIKLEVSYDGGASWVGYSDAVNGFTGTCVVMQGCGTTDCTGGCNTTNYPVPWGAAQTMEGPFIGTDDFGSNTFSDCISVGVSSTVKVRVTTVCWSGSETIRFDNVTLSCSNCALPVEIGLFTAERTEETVEVFWRTLMEIDSKKFNVQRSDDGVVFYTIGSVGGQLNSTGNLDYTFTDRNPSNKAVSYYRLEQMDYDGKMKYSDVVTVKYNPTFIYYNFGNIEVNFTELPNRDYTLNIYDLSGALVHTEIINGNTSIRWDRPGYYVVEIPEIGKRQKVLTR